MKEASQQIDQHLNKYTDMLAEAVNKFNVSIDKQHLISFILLLSSLARFPSLILPTLSPSMIDD